MGAVKHKEKNKEVSGSFAMSIMDSSRYIVDDVVRIVPTFP